MSFFRWVTLTVLSELLKILQFVFYPNNKLATAITSQSHLPLKGDALVADHVTLSVAAWTTKKYGNEYTFHTKSHNRLWFLNIATN